MITCPPLRSVTSSVSSYNRKILLTVGIEQQLSQMEVCFDQNLMKLFTINHEQINVQSIIFNVKQKYPTNCASIPSVYLSERVGRTKI